MMTQRLLTLPGIVALALSGCSLPYIPIVTDRSQEAVTVAGQACTYRSQTVQESNTLGVSRWVENSIDCGGQTYDCGDTSAGRCSAAIAAGRDPSA
jgi:hypothetical protein